METLARNICIIGGSGFIGTALTENLLLNSHVRITIVDILEPRSDLSLNPRVEFVKLDFSDFSSLKSNSLDFLKGIDVLFVKLGMLGDPYKAKDVNNCDSYININAISILRVLECADRYAVRRIFFDSSIAAVAHLSAKEPLEESQLPSSPLNFYALSKAIMEDFARYLYPKLKVRILRYPRVHSPLHPNVISHFVNNVKNGKPIKLIGEPKKVLDFVHISDVVKMNMYVMNNDVDLSCLHVSNNSPITLIGLAKMVYEKMGYDDYPIIIEEDGVVPLEPLNNSLESWRTWSLIKDFNPTPLSQMIEEVIERSLV